MTTPPARPGGAGLYAPAPGTPETDARLHAPAFDRNIAPITSSLSPLLEECTGTVLEIGSGTGQHAASFAAAFPKLTWQPSDPLPEHRASIAAWTLGGPARPPLDVDAARDWETDAQITALGPLAAIFSANVIHIAPWAVAQGIVRGAGRRLAPGGLLILYGPFREAGQHTGAGNAAFDADLRARNPAWGLRDITNLQDLATAAHLRQDRTVQMPANNRLLVFRHL